MLMRANRAAGGGPGDHAAIAGEHDPAADHGRDRDKHRNDAPERELAPHPARSTIRSASSDMELILRFDSKPL
jgi:hypothetical protein